MKQSIHDLIASSETVGVNLETLLSGVHQLIFFKNGPGGSFLAALDESTLDSLMGDHPAVAILKQESSSYDRVIVARIKQDPGMPEDYSLGPILEPSMSETYQELIDAIGKKFGTLISNYASWPTFSRFLAEDDAYDVENTHPLKQFSLDYWWLKGEVNEDAGVHYAGCYPPGHGVYVDPQTGTLPVFTGAVYGDIHAQSVRMAGGPSLEPDHLFCVGCFLGGFSKSLPIGTVKGIVLNDQWKLDCFSCNGLDDGGSHFFLPDGDQYWTLAGCKDHGNSPIWVEKRWDTPEDRYFDPKCGLVPWLGG